MKLFASVAVPPAPLCVPIHLPLVPSVKSVSLSANDNGDYGNVHISPGIYLMDDKKENRKTSARR